MFLNDSRNVFEDKFHQVAYSILEPFFKCSFFVFDWRKKKQLVCHCFPISAKSPSSSSLCCSENAAAEAHVQYDTTIYWICQNERIPINCFCCLLHSSSAKFSPTRQLNLCNQKTRCIVYCFENYKYESTALSPRASDTIITFFMLPCNLANCPTIPMLLMWISYVLQNKPLELIDII